MFDDTPAAVSFCEYAIPSAPLGKGLAVVICPNSAAAVQRTRAKALPNRTIVPVTDFGSPQEFVIAPPKAFLESPRLEVPRLKHRAPSQVRAARQ